MQAFKYIFTSPNSASTIEHEHEDDSGRPAKRVRRNAPSTRSNVATLIGMHSVTSRSIAYVAVQVSIFRVSTTVAQNIY